MKFFMLSTITDAPDLRSFFKEWDVGEGDLLLTNKFLLDAELNGETCPCDTVYQEEYGSGEPNSGMVDAILEAAEAKPYKRIIAMGGGTILDIGKVMALGAGYRCADIVKNGQSLPHGRKLIAIPTTCGTGSEVTGVAVVEFKELQTKINMRYPAIYTDEVVLIPNLLRNLPFEVFACSSIDALIHAVESYISPIANTFNRAIGRCAVETILKGYKKLAQMPYGSLPDLNGLKDFSEAATMAGIAFEVGRCGPVHALSAPISYQYHFPHGKANYVVFRTVMEFYVKKGADLDEICGIIAGALGCGKEDALKEMFLLLEKIYPNIKKGSTGAKADLCRSMAKTVLETQTFLINNGPAVFTEDEITEMFMSCL